MVHGDAGTPTNGETRSYAPHRSSHNPDSFTPGKNNTRYTQLRRGQGLPDVTHGIPCLGKALSSLLRCLSHVPSILFSATGSPLTETRSASSTPATLPATPGITASGLGTVHKTLSMESSRISRPEGGTINPP